MLQNKEEKSEFCGRQFPIQSSHMKRRRFITSTSTTVLIFGSGLGTKMVKASSGGGSATFYNVTITIAGIPVKFTSLPTTVAGWKDVAFHRQNDPNKVTVTATASTATEMQQLDIEPNDFDPAEPYHVSPGTYQLILPGPLD